MLLPFTAHCTATVKPPSAGVHRLGSIHYEPSKSSLDNQTHRVHPLGVLSTAKPASTTPCWGSQAATRGSCTLLHCTATVEPPNARVPHLGSVYHEPSKSSLDNQTHRVHPLIVLNTAKLASTVTCWGRKLLNPALHCQPWVTVGTETCSTNPASAQLKTTENYFPNPVQTYEILFKAFFEIIFIAQILLKDQNHIFKLLNQPNTLSRSGLAIARVNLGRLGTPQEPASAGSPCQLLVLNFQI